MFAYPYYQNPPMYAYSPDEYYHHSANSETSYDSHYGYEDSSPRPKHYRRRSSSTKKPRRSKSFSKLEYEEDEYGNYYNPHLAAEDNYYYAGPHRLDGVRSVSPFRENRAYHSQQHLNSRNEDAVATGRRRNTWVQPTSFVNLGQPMIHPMTQNYQIQQSLGMRATETWPGMTTNAYIPANNDLFYLPQNVPMIQPYYLHPLANNSNPFNIPATSSVASSNLSSFYPPPPPPAQQQQTNLFPNFMPIPALFQELFSQPTTMAASSSDSNQVQDHQQQDAPKKEVTPTTSQKTSPTINLKEITDHVPDTAHQQQQLPPPVTLRRKKSIMEGLLSSFALLGEEVNHAPMNNRTLSDPADEDQKRPNLTWDPTSYTSLSEALHNQSMTTSSNERKMSLSKKTSTRLSQKANALQNRQYIWCYRPYKQQQSTEINQSSSELNNQQPESPGLWAAFDMRNQHKLDQHYYFLIANSGNTTATATATASDAKHNHLPDVVTDDPHHVLVLNKQASLPGPIMVSIHDHVAWYNSTKDAQTSPDDVSLLEIACMPTVYNRLVVSNDLIKQEEEAALATKTLKRSKSMDGLASKLLNTVLGW